MTTQQRNEDSIPDCLMAMLVLSTDSLFCLPRAVLQTKERQVLRYIKENILEKVER